MKVSLEKAEEIVRANTPVLDTERLPLMLCMGKILARDVAAAISQPPFRRSAMDGYAVRREDWGQDAVSRRLPFKVIGEIHAGCQSVPELGAYEAARIMTGGKVPDSAGVVIPQEQSDMGEDYVVFHGFSAADNIAPAGEDFKAGDVIAGKGRQVDACVLACAAASGITELDVYKSPRMAVIATGDELCPWGKPLGPGQIYDSGSVYLQARLEQFHCRVSCAEQVGDDLERIAGKIEGAVSDADMVITTGGVSVGKKDFVERAVRSLGGEILFHGICVKPGMPTMCSLVRGVSVLSLSGNPYSAAAVFEWLFPFRRKIHAEGILAREFTKRRPLPRIVRGRYRRCQVDIASNQGNGVMLPGIGANCLALLPAGEEAAAAGSRVEVLLL